MSTYAITSGSTQSLSDTADFIKLLNSLAGSYEQFFNGPNPLYVTRAPGRLDVMGGIADYSGSLVLQLPIANAVHVALQKNETRTLRIVSFPATSSDEPRLFEMELPQFLHSNRPISYKDARQLFSARPEDQWAAYVAGAFLVLMREKQFDFTEGARLLIRSAVPEGKGVSSSAALEVAAMQAIVSAFEIELSSQELALLCQKVENLVVGAPCGVMDQMTAACGDAEGLLELLCQPCDFKGTLALPAEINVWGLDSGVRHSVGGSDYGTVRTAAFMGYRIIADMAGLSIQSGPDFGKTAVDDRKWGGYLANITPEEFEREYRDALPQQMTGLDFLKRYNGITDAVTSVNSEVEYPVRQATQHPIYEHSRVLTFASILKNWEGIAQAPQLGELMFQSHQSYTNCGLGSDKTDLLVELVRASSEQGLFGARITGGGSGGTVAVLGRRGSDDEIANVAQRFHETTGYQPVIISGSSPGASAFGHLRLINQATDANWRPA